MAEVRFRGNDCRLGAFSQLTTIVLFRDFLQLIKSNLGSGQNNSKCCLIAEQRKNQSLPSTNGMPTKKADISCFYKILIFSLFRERVDAKCSLGTRIEMVAFLFFFQSNILYSRNNELDKSTVNWQSIAGLRFALVRSLYSKVIYFLLTESMS